MSDVRIVTEPLGGSRLSRLLQEGRAPAHWMLAAPHTTGDWRARAAARAAEGNWDARWTALEPALAATGEAARRLDAVRRGNGVVVTTGQQPGLFGGPVYTWSKAMSALALADSLQSRIGRPTATVFWAATDDADFVEAASTVIAGVGGLEVLRATLAPDPGTPMSLAPLGDLAAELAVIAEASGSAADPRPLAALVSSYGDPTRSAGEAFVLLLRQLLAPLGIAVLDGSHPAVRAVGAGIIARALAGAAEVERALAARTAEIVRAGEAPQVQDVAGLSLVFAREGSVRRRVAVGDVPGADAILTPNVLLRPILEYAVLPTVAYVGGPGEVAYFAQVAPVAETLEVPCPVVVPRWSCTLIEPHVQRLLDRYGVMPADLVAPNALEGRLARAAMSDATASALARLRAAIAALPHLLEAESGPLGLEAAVQGASQSLQHRVDRLERRLAAAVKRRESKQMRDVITLRGALFPKGVRQERLLNPVPLFARHGLVLLDEMREAARVYADAVTGSQAAMPGATAGG